MIIDYADCDVAAEYSLADLVARDYSLRIELKNGENFEFAPDFLKDGLLVGCKVGNDFEEFGVAIEIPINTIVKAIC